MSFLAVVITSLIQGSKRWRRGDIILTSPFYYESKNYCRLSQQAFTSFSLARIVLHSFLTCLPPIPAAAEKAGKATSIWLVHLIQWKVIRE